MSAPKTDVDKQARRHRPAIWGITIAVLFGVALLVVRLFWWAEDGTDPEGAELQNELGIESEIEPASE
ncbi:hypothetical protein [Wenxinia marina]|uniref:Uncharacterized protein n=1 Tax=Wenxinia marina DSM 24838 TaxID=1123501 RepID=A0A0D0Q7Z4_9RHOB|nr:hypothetical protein [Wenxinia marina]KIQ68562.1 hypothetical protein Wenmar_02833 [Wenxinia marina DSM 24838]GGL66901.1 hypothetical protein GCM10011392_21760 [Wenxinia marina]